MPQCIWTTIQPHLQKLEMATRSIGTADNRLQDTFSLPPIWFKIQLFMSCDCGPIGDFKSEISPTLCDKKCCSSHRWRVWAQDYSVTLTNCDVKYRV